ACTGCHAGWRIIMDSGEPEKADANSSAEAKAVPSRKRRYKLAVALMLALPILWLLGDLGYSLIVGSRLRGWESGLTRNTEGVRVEGEAYTLGEGPAAILFVHGFAESPANFRPMVEHFANRGFTCRAMRLPGF